MAHFHHGIASDSIIQGSWNPCLYASTNPYSLYASSARLSRYGVSNEGFPHYADGNSGVSSSLFNGNVWYPNNSHLQTLGHAYESNCVPSVSMATITPGQQSFGEVATSLTALQMANDFAGFSEASNVAKCYKPAHPFYWRKRGNSVPAEGMTRTKDKYRVVYTEKQRIGLEKAFKDNKFITMKEKNVLSKDLDLSERQIKIWFQNRRAKERRQRRKAEVEQEDHVINEEQENDSPDSPDSGDVSTFLNARTYVTQLSPGNYTEVPSFDDATKSQCRYQQNASCVSATSPVFYQRQTQNFSTSPTDWSQRGLSLTKCDVSPFAANPDLMYRS